MTTVTKIERLKKILHYDRYAEELRARIPEEYGKAALIKEIVSLAGYSVAIYGAGNVGTALFLWLREKGIQSKFFIDRKETNTPLDIPILKMNDAEKMMRSGKYIVLIAVNTTPYEQNMIKKDLVAHGAQSVMLYADIQCQLEIWSRDILNSRTSLMETFQLMADNESREAYVEYFRVKMERDFWREKEHDFTEKYFCEELFDIKRIDTYVCLGGYTGDSVLRFLDKAAAVKNIIVFEPQEKYLPVMQEMFSYLDGEIQRTIQIIEKEAGDVDSATIAKIDDIVPRGGDILISADIEGAELAALRGAKQLLRANSPILAFSAYHKFDDFSLLTNYILEQNSRYKFYVRKYRSCASVPANEIVLYGIAR